MFSTECKRSALEESLVISDVAANKVPLLVLYKCWDYETNAVILT